MLITPTFYGETDDGPRRTVFRAAEDGQRLDGFDGLWVVASGPPLSAYTAQRDEAWFVEQYRASRIRPQMDDIAPVVGPGDVAPRPGHGVSDARVAALVKRLAKGDGLTERQAEDLAEILGAV